MAELPKEHPRITFWRNWDKAKTTTAQMGLLPSENRSNIFMRQLALEAGDYSRIPHSMPDPEAERVLTRRRALARQRRRGRESTIYTGLGAESAPLGG